jgi:hypothetical protein
VIAPARSDMTLKELRQAQLQAAHDVLGSALISLEQPQHPAPLGCISGSMARQPETWNPPIATCRPAARSGRAMSSARGNWFDCTPTRPCDMEIGPGAA